MPVTMHLSVKVERKNHRILSLLSIHARDSRYGDVSTAALIGQLGWGPDSL